MKPPALKRKPKLEKADRYYYDSFLELSGSRPGGEAFGHIPQSEYNAWFTTYCIFGVEARERHQRAMSALDNAYVEHINKKRQQEADRLKNQRPGGSGLKLG